MRIRHANMLDRANFLQTEAEPRLVRSVMICAMTGQHRADQSQYYRPWELRPDEEDRIQDQIKGAQARIDKELEEFNQQRGRPSVPEDRRSCRVSIGLQSLTNIQTIQPNLPLLLVSNHRPAISV